MSLPPLSALTAPEPLTLALSTLFEPSPPLHALLVPAVLRRLVPTSARDGDGDGDRDEAAAKYPATYPELIDLCADVARGWTMQQKAEFLEGHPVIGEQGKVSALSGKEQGGAGAARTPGVVLARLAHLNAIYSTVFPSLRYITFVNGRSRAEIVTELEGVIGLPLSPVPLPGAAGPDSEQDGAAESYDPKTPALHSEAVRALRRQEGGGAWCDECERGLADVWRIGKARLGALAVEEA